MSSTLAISDRLSVEQVKTPCWQSSETWDSFNFSVRRPQQAEWMKKAQKMRQMAEKYIPKFRMKKYQWYINCLLSETSDSVLVFAVYIGNPQLTNEKVLIADHVKLFL